MLNLMEIERQAEESYHAVVMAIRIDDRVIGHMSLMVDPYSCYLERIDIDEAERGKGHGTHAMQMLTSMHNTVYAAPDNPDSQRLFARIGEPYDDDAACYVDQGYGVCRI